MALRNEAVAPMRSRSSTMVALDKSPRKRRYGEPIMFDVPLTDTPPPPPTPKTPGTPPATARAVEEEEFEEEEEDEHEIAKRLYKNVSQHRDATRLEYEVWVLRRFVEISTQRHTGRIDRSMDELIDSLVRSGMSMPKTRWSPNDESVTDVVVGGLVRTHMTSPPVTRPVESEKTATFCSWLTHRLKDN